MLDVICWLAVFLCCVFTGRLRRQVPRLQEADEDDPGLV